MGAGRKTRNQNGNAVDQANEVIALTKEEKVQISTGRFVIVAQMFHFHISSRQVRFHGDL